MSSLSLRLPVLLAALALGAPALAQTDPAIQAIRDRGVGANNAAEQMMNADAAEDARAERGEEKARETPRPAEPLPTGDIEVGDVQTAPLEDGEEADPAADAEDGVDSDLPEL